jgi:hypothetical protein
VYTLAFPAPLLSLSHALSLLCNMYMCNQHVYIIISAYNSEIQSKRVRGRSCRPARTSSKPARREPHVLCVLVCLTA